MLFPSPALSFIAKLPSDIAFMLGDETYLLVKHPVHSFIRFYCYISVTAS